MACHSDWNRRLAFVVLFLQAKARLLRPFAPRELEEVSLAEESSGKPPPPFSWRPQPVLPLGSPLCFLLSFSPFPPLRNWRVVCDPLDTTVQTVRTLSVDWRPDLSSSTSAHGGPWRAVEMPSHPGLQVIYVTPAYYQGTPLFKPS